MSKLLIDESPILVLPSLAQQIGLNEAIFIQQLHYWLKDSSNIKDKHKWVYNTYDGWQEQFPFWSISTLRRIITKLEKLNLIVIGNYNKLQIDKTKWYRINYQVLESMNSPSVQNEQSDCSDWTDGDINMNRALPEITTEITTEKEKEEEGEPPSVSPFRFFEENGFGTIGSHISQKISMWCDDLSDDLVLEAMRIAVERGVKNWAYVEKILVNWAEKKVTTVEQVHAIMLAFKEQQSKKYGSARETKTRTEKLPDWFLEEEKEITGAYKDRQADDIESKESEDKEVEEFLKERRREALEERLKKLENQ